VTPPRSGRTALIERPAAAGAFSAALLAAVLWPVRENWRAEKNDSFPLSYYPMFSARRRRSVRVTHMVGFDAGGGRHLLPYTCAGRGGLNQVRKQIARRLEAGGADELCHLVARETAALVDPSRPALVSVSVVTCEYGLEGWFAGLRDPVREWCHGTVPVPVA